jgi:uncharacterized protein
MSDLTIMHYVLIVLLSFMASTVSTAIGFGINIILVSFLQFFVPPVQIVGIGIIIGTLSAAMRTVDTRKVDTAGASWRMIIPGVLAIPLGLVILYFADAVFLKRLFSVIILTAAMPAIVAGKAKQRRLSDANSARAVQIALGAVGGMMNGSSSMPGPPLVFCSLLQNWEKMHAHALFARYFLATGVATGIGLFVSGLFDWRAIVTGLCLTPIVWGGFAVGIRIRNRISQKRFQTYTTLCLILLGVAGFVNTFFVNS